MPTTTNFSWTTPADTDLVKDGALAIRTLADGIDTSFVDLKGGTTGQALTKNSNTDLDFTWATTGGENYALINTGGTALTGAQTITVNVSNKNKIFVYIDRASSASASSYMRWRINTDSGSNYFYVATGNDIAIYNGGGAASEIICGRMGTAAGDTVTGYLIIEQANSTGIKTFIGNGSGTGTSFRHYASEGYYSGASAITSVSFNSETGNFDSGTMYVYGA